MTSLAIDLIDQPIPDEIEDMTLRKLAVAKVLLEKALKKESVKVEVDMESPKFKDELNKRIFIKNIKQKISFAVGSVPTSYFPSSTFFRV
jgi:hypothetical protein